MKRPTNHIRLLFIVSLFGGRKLVPLHGSFRPLSSIFADVQIAQRFFVPTRGDYANEHLWLRLTIACVQGGKLEKRDV